MSKKPRDRADSTPDRLEEADPAGQTAAGDAPAAPPAELLEDAPSLAEQFKGLCADRELALSEEGARFVLAYLLVRRGEIPADVRRWTRVFRVRVPTAWVAVRNCNFIGMQLGLERATQDDYPPVTHGELQAAFSHVRDLLEREPVAAAPKASATPASSPAP